MIIQFRPFFRFCFVLPHGVVARPDFVALLMNAFSSLEVIPTTINGQQFVYGLGENGVNMAPQLRFITPFRNLIIDFEPDRYTIGMVDVPNIQVPEFDVFCKKAEQIIDILQNEIKMDAERLVFMTSGISKRMTESEINKIHETLFVLPEHVKTQSYIEWNCRQVYRENRTINTKDEQLNVIFNINRLDLAVQPDKRLSEYKGIEISLDINTFQENRRQRFSKDDVLSFLSEAGKIQMELENTIERMIQAV